jgi:hypothetical protein
VLLPARCQSQIPRWLREGGNANDSSRDLNRNFRAASLVCGANRVFGCQIAALDQLLAIIGSRHD